MSCSLRLSETGLQVAEGAQQVDQDLRYTKEAGRVLRSQTPHTEANRMC